MTLDKGSACGQKGLKCLLRLSGGEQQRIDIARPCSTPQLILAIEPTGNLDPETSDEIMNLLLNIARDANVSVVMATRLYRCAEVSCQDNPHGKGLVLDKMPP